MADKPVIDSDELFADGDAIPELKLTREDILDAIKADGVAWKNYQNFSDSYKRIRVAFIEGARKRPEEFQKRLNNFIKKTRENKQIGFGGIEKYY